MIYFINSSSILRLNRNRSYLCNSISCTSNSADWLSKPNLVTFLDKPLDIITSRFKEHNNRWTEIKSPDFTSLRNMNPIFSLLINAILRFQHWTLTHFVDRLQFLRWELLQIRTSTHRSHHILLVTRTSVLAHSRLLKRFEVQINALIRFQFLTKSHISHSHTYSTRKNKYFKIRYYRIKFKSHRSDISRSNVHLSELAMLPLSEDSHSFIAFINSLRSAKKDNNYLELTRSLNVPHA